jgi:radical SAM protein with 4Fe4S-binding SPASM domain
MKLLLAITRKCNANCVFCVYQFAREEDKIHMSDGIFELALERIQQARIECVMLSPNIGEPLIAPHFMDKLKRLRAVGVKHIEITTNALGLHQFSSREMLTDGPDRINISFAGFDKEMYERDFRVRHYERTRDSIMELLRTNRVLDAGKEINLRIRGDLPSEALLAAPEMEEAIQLANDVERMTEVDSWLGMITEEILPRGYVLQKEATKVTRRPCVQLWDLTIHPDGDIHLCSCRNVRGDPDLHIGNIKEMTLLEAHERIKGVLDRWESGSVPMMCKTCSMYSDPAIGLVGRWRRIRQSNRRRRAA